MKDLRPGWDPDRPLVVRVVAAVVAPGVVTLLALPDRHPPIAVIAVLYVLAVVIAARVGGAIYGIAASVASFLSLNFFFTEPLHTFEVGAPEDLVALLVFLLTSVIVGLLLSSAVSASERAQRREMEALLLNRLATRLLSGESTGTVLADLAQGLCEVFGMAACEIATSFTARAYFEKERGAGSGESHDVQLVARDEEIGVMRIWLGSRDRLSPDEFTVIRSLATQLALALEGMRLSVEIRKAELEAQASQLKAALFSGVTHDVKTPLAAITAAVTSLIDGQGFSAESRRDHLETIKQEADRLHRVVNNLLDVARLRAGALVAKKSPAAIDELMESVVARLRPLLEDRDIEIRVGANVPDTPMDVVQIDQVLTNLIENAIKFTPAGSAITLTAVGHDRGVRVTVSDNGSGVPPIDRERIFEPFERGGAGGTGTGLGLAIAKAIVSAHGGRMWVSDAATGGASFTFELPRDSVDAGGVIADARTGARG